jgi:hypothetical protein
MSFENDGLPASWEEIKAASQRLVRRGNTVVEKSVARKYLADEDSDDSRVKEHLAIPGYN